MTVYRCTNLKIVVTVGATNYTIGVCEGMDIDLSYEGGAEPVYGNRTRQHSAGSKVVSFSLTRWFYADTGQQDLLLDLFDAETSFTIEATLVTNAGADIANTSVKLTGCRLYRWRPRTGGADDIIGEEASGQATGWTLDVTNP